MSDTYEIVEEAIRTNYYGVKRMCEAMIPLLEASDSPRIVSIASTMGMLQVKSSREMLVIIGFDNSPLCFIQYKHFLLFVFYIDYRMCQMNGQKEC